jgi:hypothetical protein
MPGRLRFLGVAVEAGGLLRGLETVEFATSLFLRPTRPPIHRTCQGGELNSRPRAYESPALPLSYPGV